MDRTDKRILALLEQNARISTAELGRQIGLSRTAVQDRITKLEASGNIIGYHAEISYSQSEPIRTLLFVKIAVHPSDKVLNWLVGLEGVQEVICISGEIDAIVKCCVPNTAAMIDLNDKIGSSDLVTSSSISLVLKQIR